ncbi:MAG: TetR/AcrR family transcriptional regulator [Actinomycetes bacterium]
MGEPDVASDPLRAADGRVPGRRGRATRTKLLECLEGMLASSSFRDLKVTDVTREAGTSPATFYQYFPDIETAVLAIAEQMAEEGSRLRACVTDGTWRGNDAYATAEQVVDGFLAFWEQHQSLLRVIDLAVLEGDTRFRDTRVRMLNSVTSAFADVIASLRKDDDAAEPTAMSGALVAMLAHTAAHQDGFESWDIHVRELRRALADLVYWGVTGRKPSR